MAEKTPPKLGPPPTEPIRERSIFPLTRAATKRVKDQIAVNRQKVMSDTINELERDNQVLYDALGDFLDEGPEDRFFVQGVIYTYSMIQEQVRISNRIMITVSPEVIDSYFQNVDEQLDDQLLEDVNAWRDQIPGQEKSLREAIESLPEYETDPASHYRGASIIYRIIKSAYEAEEMKRKFSTDD